MNRDSNKHTYIFAILMVVSVAFVLSFTSESLKDLQNSNVKKEKMQNILSSVGINVSRDESEDLYMDRATSRTFVEKSISMSGCFLSVIESMKLLVATLISSIQSEGTSNEKVLFPFTRITGGMSSISPVLLVIRKIKKAGVSEAVKRRLDQF